MTAHFAGCEDTHHDCAARLLCCAVQLQNQALLHAQQPCAIDFCWVSRLSVWVLQPVLGCRTMGSDAYLALRLVKLCRDAPAPLCCAVPHVLCVL